MEVLVFTNSNEGSEPIRIHWVTSVVALNGTLLIEADTDLEEHSSMFTTHHRFERGQWTRFETSRLEGVL